jgi:hypothetical protein
MDKTDVARSLMGTAGLGMRLLNEEEGIWCATSSREG